MDIPTFDKHVHLSRPIAPSDARHIKRLLFNPVLKDIYPVIEHFLLQGLKLEQVLMMSVSCSDARNVPVMSGIHMHLRFWHQA